MRLLFHIKRDLQIECNVTMADVIIIRALWVKTMTNRAWSGGGGGGYLKKNE